MINIMIAVFKRKNCIAIRSVGLILHYTPNRRFVA